MFIISPIISQENFILSNPIHIWQSLGVGVHIASNVFIILSVWIIFLLLAYFLYLLKFKAVGDDITDRQQAEIALRESEERFRSLVAHIPGVVYRCTPDTHRTMEFISDAIAEISGYPARDFLHNQVRSFASITAWEDRERVEQIVSECVAKAKPYVLEYRIIRKDGSVRWVYEKGQGVFSTEGNLLCLDGVIFDITEYRQTQEDLRTREEQFRQLTETIHEVFFLISPDLREMLYISPAYEDVWGQSTQSLYKQPQSWFNSVHPEDRDRITAALTEHLHNKQDFQQEYRIVRPDGSVRWVWVRAFHVLNEAGVSQRVAGIAEDITERKLAEVEILNALSKEKELGDLKSRFISITSHEFRTPLTTIMSTAELLEYYDWTPEEQTEQLHLIQDAVKDMLQLLSDLLFIGTAEAGQVQFNPEPLALDTICQELVTQFQQEISVKATSTGVQHSLTLACRGQSFLACMDKKLLRQLLGNLLSNAIKYSPNGGQIDLELTCQGDQAIFQIQDQGIGIPSEDLPRLFDFFYRAKNVGAIAGTGLGLAIVKTCVDLHRGEIAVKSEIGIGTRFRVSLPLKNHFLRPMLNSLPPHSLYEQDAKTPAP
jgi:PAS domain S-box-containing protein